MKNGFYMCTKGYESQVSGIVFEKNKVYQFEDGEMHSNLEHGISRNTKTLDLFNEFSWKFREAYPKEILQNGDDVTLKHDLIGIYSAFHASVFSVYSVIPLQHYDDNLIHEDNRKTILKIERDGVVIWEREEDKTILDIIKEKFDNYLEHHSLAPQYLILDKTTYSKFIKEFPIKYITYSYNQCVVLIHPFEVEQYIEFSRMI